MGGRSSSGKPHSAYGNDAFLLHDAVTSGLQRIKAKVPVPQFLRHHGQDKPHYESLLVVITRNKRLHVGFVVLILSMFRLFVFLYSSIIYIMLYV